MSYFSNLVAKSLAAFGLTLFVAATASAQSYYIDNFQVVKNGNTLFNETFSEGLLPPLAPNTNSGNAISYAVTGSFAAGDLANGQLRLDPSTQGVLSHSATGAVTSGFVAAVLQTNNDPANTTQGLKTNTTFSVTGIFDLIPPNPSDKYGIRLEDGHPEQTNQGASLDLRLGTNASGQFQVSLRSQDFVLGTANTIEAIDINPSGYDEIALTLSRADLGNNAITASFQFLSAGNLIGAPTVFTSTSNIFNYANWAQAAFVASNTAPVPEPETYAMLLAGLGLLRFVARRRKQKVA